MEKGSWRKRIKIKKNSRMVSGAVAFAVLAVLLGISAWGVRSQKNVTIRASSGCTIVNTADGPGCWCSDGGWQFHCGVPDGQPAPDQCINDCAAKNPDGGGGGIPPSGGDGSLPFDPLFCSGKVGLYTARNISGVGDMCVACNLELPIFPTWLPIPVGPGVCPAPAFCNGKPMGVAKETAPDGRIIGCYFCLGAFVGETNGVPLPNALCALPQSQAQSLSESAQKCPVSPGLYTIEGQCQLCIKKKTASKAISIPVEKLLNLDKGACAPRADYCQGQTLGPRRVDNKCMWCFGKKFGESYGLQLKGKMRQLCP